jgi:hypothetical protein
MVEFAMIVTLVLFILLVSVQAAVLADASLAVNQLVYQGVRYAAVNPTFDSTTVANWVKSSAPSIVGENNGGHLTVTLNPDAPRTFGSAVTMTISYDTSSKIVLANPFLGIPFPTTLSATETAMSE